MVEGDLGLGLLNLGEERHEGLDEIEEPYCMAGRAGVSRVRCAEWSEALVMVRVTTTSALTRVLTRDSYLRELMVGNGEGDVERRRKRKG